MYNIRVFLEGRLVPFTKISGNRPFLVPDDTLDFDTSVESFKRQYDFYEVPQGKFHYNRLSVKSATITVDVKSVRYLVEDFSNRYVIVHINNDRLLYFVDRMVKRQNNVVEFMLSLDVIATYLHKIPKSNVVTIDRVNYDMKSNINLLHDTLKYNDESIGLIYKSSLYLPKPNSPIYLNDYSYREYTSNDIANGDIKKFNNIDGYLHKRVKYEKETIEKDSHKTFYGKRSIEPFTYYINKGEERYQIMTDPIGNEPDSNIRDIENLWYKPLFTFEDNLTKVYLEYVIIENGEKKYKSFYYGSFSDIRGGHITEKGFRENIINGIIKKYGLIGPRLEGDKSFYITLEYSKNNVIEYDIPKLFDVIPPIQQLVDFSVISWAGSKINIHPLHIDFLNYKLKTRLYNSYTNNNFNHYFKIESSVGLNKDIVLDNAYEISLSKDIHTRFDSKEEYLASNRNKLDTDKLFGGINMLLGIVNSGVVGQKLFDKLSGAVYSGVGYANKLAKIDSTINDIGNTRSSFIASESDTYLRTENANLFYYNYYGTNLSVQLPGGEMFKILRRHFYKFGYKVNIERTFGELLSLTTHNEKFLYFKLTDTTSLFNDTTIPNEVMEEINGLFINGVHLWKPHKKYEDVTTSGERVFVGYEWETPNYTPPTTTVTINGFIGSEFDDNKSGITIIRKG